MCLICERMCLFAFALDKYVLKIAKIVNFKPRRCNHHIFHWLIGNPKILSNIKTIFLYFGFQNFRILWSLTPEYLIEIYKPQTIFLGMHLGMHIQTQKYIKSPPPRQKCGEYTHWDLKSHNLDACFEMFRRSYGVFE